VTPRAHETHTSRGSPQPPHFESNRAGCLVRNQNITCLDTEIRFLDGDGLVVRNSQNVNIDAGPYDE